MFISSWFERLVFVNATMSRFYWNHLMRPVSRKPLFGNYVKSCKIQSFIALFMFGSFLCFLFVVSSSFHSNLPSQLEIEHNGNEIRNSTTLQSDLMQMQSESCDLFDGTWVVDESYPLYNSSQCPFAERGFDCLANGRTDQGYLKWRWKPNDCEIPRFSARLALERLRGKRVVFVGDSLSRTQWESMICMLMTGVEDKSSVYEVNGNKITKQIRHLAVRFRSYDFRIEFYRSIFLVRHGPAPRRSPKRVKAALKLDQMDEISGEWIDSDILVFNSGHWWTPTKLFEMGWYFQVGGRMKLGMTINNAFRVALTTWQTWIEKSINPKRTQVFFRTFESTHWRSGTRLNCNVTTEPSFEDDDPKSISISDAIINASKNSSVPVKVLHVTSMGAYRSDAHVGYWSDKPSVPDCSHWCLPGVPDMWNELLFSSVISK